MDAQDTVKIAPVVLDTRGGRLTLLSTVPLDEALKIPTIAAAMAHVDAFVYEPQGDQR